MRRLLTVSMLLVLAALALPAPRVHSAAFNISITETCYSDKADVTFSWQGANSASQQYLDLSLFNNGWRDGTFVGRWAYCWLSHVIYLDGVGGRLSSRRQS
jgi:hypothetical protein